MSVDVVVDDKAARARLDDMIGRLEDPEQLLRLLGDEITAHEAEAFATSGFGAWASDDPYTVKSKGSGRVLVDNGGLLDSLVHPSRGAVRVTSDSVTVSSDEVSGLMAQRGARGMPKRNPAPAPTATQLDGWAEDILGFLVEGQR